VTDDNARIFPSPPIQGLKTERGEPVVGFLVQIIGEGYNAHLRIEPIVLHNGMLQTTILDLVLDEEAR
jgi:hypothetical protein